MVMISKYSDDSKRGLQNHCDGVDCDDDDGNDYFDDDDEHHDHDDIRETVREGWVSEVAEGQFPYLYFWPC